MQHHQINYLELPARDLTATVAFFKQVFAWSFTYYGEEYVAFSDSGLEGGFYQSGLTSVSHNGGALVVLYSEDLSHSLAQVEQAGGHITKAIFEFPGGRRFQFTEPSGNEFAVWSDK